MWTQIRPNKMSGLVWIQSVWHSDGSSNGWHYGTCVLLFVLSTVSPWHFFASNESKLYVVFPLIADEILDSLCFVNISRINMTFSILSYYLHVLNLRFYPVKKTKFFSGLKIVRALVPLITSDYSWKNSFLNINFDKNQQPTKCHKNWPSIFHFGRQW